MLPHEHGIYLTMDTRPPSEIGPAERAEIFHEQYGNDVDAGDTLADLMIGAGDFIARIVGQEKADAAMALIAKSLAGSRERDERDWRTIIDEERSSCFSEWALGERLHDLAAYAVYGIVLHASEDPQVLANHIQTMLSEAEEFARLAPMEAWGLKGRSNTDLDRLIQMARGRWELDNGRPVELAALAAFGGVAEGTLRNMTSGAGRKFALKDGRVDAIDALAWLNTRKDQFWNSVWREQRLPQYADPQRPALDNVVFVPVARDESVFHPGLRRGAGYTIGDKGDEFQIGDFHEALEALQRMPKAHWRRPNRMGHWGIVVGVRWERYDLSDLELIAQRPTADGLAARA